MIIEPFDIVDAHVAFGHAQYPRPCIVLRVENQQLANVMQISSAMDLYLGPGVHFRIYPDDPNFVSTGLKKECYAASDRIEELELTRILKKRGRLEGALLKQFKDWYGIQS